MKNNAPAEWLYFNSNEITVRSIKEVFDEDKTISNEIWDEAGVLELAPSNTGTMEFEVTKLNLGDDYSNQFLQDNDTKSLFFVTIDIEHYEKMSEMMNKIISALGGFFCGDTEDFTPMIGK